MSRKSSPKFQWTDDDIQLQLEVMQNLKVEKDYKGLKSGLNSECMLVTLHTKCKINVITF